MSHTPFTRHIGPRVWTALIELVIVVGMGVWVCFLIWLVLHL